VRKRVLTTVRIGTMMARSGLLAPGPPGRMAGQLGALRRWGTVLGGSFVSAAARDPDRPAIIDDDGTLTYAEVDERTNRLAHVLGPHRVAVLCRNHRGMIETLIACSKAGSDVILLNTGMSTAQLISVLDQQHAEVLVADAEFADLLASVPAEIRTYSDQDLNSAIGTASEAGLEPPPHPGRTIVLSSGTTGRPKGADRQSRPGMQPLASILSRIPFKVHDTVLIEAPLFHTWGYAMLQVAIALRTTIVLRRRFAPEETLRAIDSARCTALVAVPVMLQRVMELPEEVRARYSTESLRIAALSGSALPGGLATAFMAAYGDILYNLYGSTESSWVTIATPEDLRADPTTAGTAPPGTQVAILDERGQPVPTGTRGRIFAANELLFSGYTAGPAKEMHDGLMSLGDIGHLDEHGRLFVDGRDDDMVVSGGENIFPSAVEEVIEQHPKVREVAVLGVPDEEFGRRLAAWVVASAPLTADEVRDHVRAQLARFAVPRDVHFVDELPRNATGKVLRRSLLNGLSEH